MQIFTCPNCGTTLYFRNTTCRCGSDVFFDPDRQSMSTQGTACANRQSIGCNWIAEDGEDGDLCRSCAMTEVTPDLREAQNAELWATAEFSKRWMLANLARWGWFTPRDPGTRPVFKMLSEQTAKGETEIIMGHADGIITINVTESSDAELAKRQENLGELYRTMLGHMRHETAHFLQLRLAEDPRFLSAFREIFGDERADYGEALETHYASPKPADATHITSYATAHPHEDWAETTAHLLHLIDLVDSAASARLSLPEGPQPGHDAYGAIDLAPELTMAVDLALAINHVNRAMDLSDLYPFAVPDGVRDKMAFIHRWLRDPAQIQSQPKMASAG
ncbi:putative zinc-binding peptidase [Citreicella sp. C3M06]|uniref:zinc-binding metallopeptidase family protein n=1 Tax=Citreicella sp. C3M06 TaxID=2841564 RepID=UPI001C08228C|nr:putative zinc-binding metallopeptidase [Citreicella sp. C3M06]MBU2963706.1 putative zinc-binding peptidase [Citreicella sp. C3M06]